MGQLVSDKVAIPSLLKSPVLYSDFAAITKSDNFFINSSGGQVSKYGSKYN
jgi:hypothetical protein